MKFYHLIYTLPHTKTRLHLDLIMTPSDGRVNENRFAGKETLARGMDGRKIVSNCGKICIELQRAETKSEETGGLVLPHFSFSKVVSS